MKDIPLNDRIILALDVESAEQAKELVRKTESHIGFYKVGLQLFMASWFNIVDWLSARGHKVMVDLKFFDIPETVKLAVAQLNSHQVTFATIHGNDPIIKAAVEAKGDLALLAVTVLTSFGDIAKVHSAIQAGAMGYLLKDSSPDQLINAIRSVSMGHFSLPGDLVQKVMQKNTSPIQATNALHDPLSKREWDVLRCIAKGMSNDEIAEALEVPVGTVKSRMNAALIRLRDLLAELRKGD